jgi:mRNA interferase MazF
LVKKYVPERGDIVWLTFDPQAGHEQAGRRPAIVLSKVAYNAKRGLMIAAPITSQIKGYPLEVPIDVKKRASVVLPDHVRSVDWRARRAAFVGKAPPAALDRVAAIVASLIEA